VSGSSRRSDDGYFGSSGGFWRQDGFDHLVRSAEQFEQLRRDIADNPRKARLSDGVFIVWSKPIARSEPK
jgi:hypothetical protein